MVAVYPILSSTAVRDLAAKLEKKRNKAEAALPQLEQDYNNFAIAESREYTFYIIFILFEYLPSITFILTYIFRHLVVSIVPTMLEENDLPADQVPAAAASTTTLLLRFLGISAPSGSDVAGALITDEGVDIINRLVDRH